MEKRSDLSEKNFRIREKSDSNIYLFTYVNIKKLYVLIEKKEEQSAKKARKS